MLYGLHVSEAITSQLRHNVHVLWRWQLWLLDFSFFFFLMKSRHFILFIVVMFVLTNNLYVIALQTFVWITYNNGAKTNLSVFMLPLLCSCSLIQTLFNLTLTAVLTKALKCFYFINDHFHSVVQYSFFFPDPADLWASSIAEISYTSLPVTDCLISCCL